MKQSITQCFFLLAVLLFAACADAVGQDKWWIPSSNGRDLITSGEGIEVEHFPAYGFDKYADNENTFFYTAYGAYQAHFPNLVDAKVNDIIFAQTFYKGSLEENAPQFIVSITSEEGGKAGYVLSGKGENRAAYVYLSDLDEKLSVDFRCYGYVSYEGYLNSEYNYSLMKYGAISSYEFKLTSGQTIEEYVSGKDFKSMSEEAIISTLSNDFLCNVTDTYGNKVTVACPNISWSVEMDKGRAICNVLFAPLSLLGLDLSGIEMWLSSDGEGCGEYFQLWDASSQASVANVFDNEDVDVMVDGHSILSASGRKTYVYSLSGSLVGIAADGHMNVPEGMYIVKQGLQTKKVTVKP